MVLSHGTLLVYLEHYKLILQTMLGPDQRTRMGRKYRSYPANDFVYYGRYKYQAQADGIAGPTALYIHLVLLVMEISTGHMFQHIQD